MSTEWYFKKNGLSGPFTTEEIQQLIIEREITEETKLKQNNSEWRAAKDFTELVFIVEEDTKPFVRPWLRYWARHLDLLIISAITGGILALPLSDSQLGKLSHNFLIGFTMLLLFIPFEALMISLLGTTPGKWIFGIKVRAENGAKLSFKKAFHRSLLVWWRGQGAGIPIASFLTNLNGYQVLKHELGRTTWDRDVRAAVSHHPKVLWREILIYIAIILLIYFLIRTSLLSKFF